MPPTTAAAAPTPRKPADAAYFSGLIHGPHGQGKTHLLGTAQDDPRTYPMAFLAFEPGESTLAGLDIDVFDIQTSRDWDALYRDFKKPGCPYRSLGVDSLTEVQISMLIEMLGSNSVNRADPDQLAQQDWGIVLVRMRRIIRQFSKMLPMHTFMTALSKDDVIPRIGTVKAPAMQGSFAHEMPGIMDLVGYLALEDVLDQAGKPTGMVDRVLLMHSNPKFSVKCRTPWGVTVPSEIVNPSVTSILDTLGFQ